MPVSTAEYNPCGWRAWLNNTTIYPWDAERVRFRSAVCGWSLREQLRQIACHDQRPVLVRPAKEKILTELEQFIPDPKLGDFCCAAILSSKKSSRH